MKIILAFAAIALLQGCAVIESRQHLHALETDLDCTYRGKPAEYRMPSKCGVSSYGVGHHVSIIKTGPRSYIISK